MRLDPTRASADVAHRRPSSRPTSPSFPTTSPAISICCSLRTRSPTAGRSSRSLPAPPTSPQISLPAYGSVSTARRCRPWLKPIAARLDPDPDEAMLAAAYDQTLNILFRLLFVAYGEDKDLLPYDTNSRYADHSLKRIARRLGDDIESRTRSPSRSPRPTCGRTSSRSGTRSTAATRVGASRPTTAASSRRIATPTRPAPRSPSCA